LDENAAMQVHVKSWLPCTAQQMWEAIQSSALLQEVSPNLGDSPILLPSPMPARWTDASQIVLQLPWFGRRTIAVERVDPHRVVRRWHHTMAVTTAPQGGCYYADTVEIDAGACTLPVYVLAQYLYRYRHRGWKKVARRIVSGQPVE
jgi:hypothetical protein